MHDLQNSNYAKEPTSISLRRIFGISSENVRKKNDLSRRFVWLTQKSNMADNMAADFTERTNFDELCATCEQMELDVSRTESSFQLLTIFLCNFCILFVFVAHWLCYIPWNNNLSTLALSKTWRIFFVSILSQGVASGDVYTQLLALYLFQNDT